MNCVFIYLFIWCLSVLSGLYYMRVFSFRFGPKLRFSVERVLWFATRNAYRIAWATRTAYSEYKRKTFTRFRSKEAIRGDIACQLLRLASCMFSHPWQWFGQASVFTRLVSASSFIALRHGTSYVFPRFPPVTPPGCYPIFLRFSPFSQLGLNVTLLSVFTLSRV